MPDPIIASAGEQIGADGASFSVHAWRGSGPPQMHVHYGDDEAWHVVSGSLRFRFSDRTFDAHTGTTVFVPAGVPHTYEALSDALYLIILTPRLRTLIKDLQATPADGHAEIYARHNSALVE